MADKNNISPFARLVYKAVLAIPLGEVRSYKWVARKAGRPRAYRAVGTALKNNPYPLIIPCHRVVKNSRAGGRLCLEDILESKAKGVLGGYSRGRRNKRLILELERRIALCLTNRE